MSAETPEKPADQQALIQDYRTELVEPGCHPGTGKFGVRLALRVDISGAMPYLHAVWDHASYDPDNHILIWGDTHQRYALRPLEIRIGRVKDTADGEAQAAQIVERINAVWSQRDQITPRYTVRRVPPALELFTRLPRTNCRECGRPTCLAFANELRQGTVCLNDCPPLGGPDFADARQELLELLGGEEAQRGEG